jgi:hypothetical protein
MWGFRDERFVAGELSDELVTVPDIYGLVTRADPNSEADLRKLWETIFNGAVGSREWGNPPPRMN